MSDLFDDLDFEMLGGDFEDPFENEPVDPMPPPVTCMPNAGHQPVQHPKAAVQKASEADCTEGPAQHRILAPPHQASAEAFTNAEAQVTKADDNAADTAAYYRKHHGGDRGDRLCVQHRCTGQINDPLRRVFSRQHQCTGGEQ